MRTFHEFLSQKEGLMMPDKNALFGLSRVNPFSGLVLPKSVSNPFKAGKARKRPSVPTKRVGGQGAA